MAINPIALKVYVPESGPDPLGQYAKLMSLREMIEQGRRRQAIYEQEKEKLQWEREDRQEKMSLADLLRSNPNPSREQIVSTAPFAGRQFLQTMDAQERERRLAQDAELTRRKNINQQIAAVGMQAAQIQDPLERAQFHGAKIAELADQGIIKPEEFGKHRIPADQREAEMEYGSAFGPDKLRELRDKAAQETRSQSAEARAQSQEADRALAAVQEREKRRQELTGTQPVTTYQQAQLDQSARANSPDEIIAMLNDPRTPPDRKPALKATLDQMLQYHTQVRPSVVTAIPGLADAVLQNPNLWDNLTPSAKTEIAPEIARRGGGAIFGKPLSEGAITKLSDSRSAVAALRDLREVLKANEQYIGPVSGLQAMNPYSEARKAQANIDMVRQRVGKALEGGVLRKEDEEKYKKILATLTDVPSTAIYKVDQLVDTLTRDIETFTEEQKKAGRRVSPAETEPAKPKPSGAGRPPLDSFYRK